MTLTIPKLHQKFETCTESPAQYLVVMSEIPLGIFTINGDITGWHTLNTHLNSHLTKSRYSDTPALIYNLHPEQSFIGGLLDHKTKRDYIGSGDEKGLQCLSNIRLIRIDDNIKHVFNRVPIPQDIHLTSLSHFKSDSGVFAGNYSASYSMRGFSDVEDGKFRNIWLGLGERFSGQRRKLPLSLSKDGTLTTPASDKPFTHIGKFPQIGGHESLAVTEFMGLSAAKAAGLKVTEFALISQGPQLPPMFVTERFDIATSTERNTDEIIIMQDFYSINGEDPAKAKNFRGAYETFLSQWRHQLRDEPPQRQLEEMREAFTSLLVSYIINDNDKHAKNFSSLKRVCNETYEKKDLSFAPTYDAVCNVVTGRDGSEMFFKLRDKDQSRRKMYHMHDWLNLLKSNAMKVGEREYGIFETQHEAEEYIRDITHNAARAVLDIQENPPEVCKNNDFSSLIEHDMKVAAALACQRATSLGAEDLETSFDVNEVWRRNKKIGAKQRETSIDRLPISSFLDKFKVENSRGADFPCIAAE